LPTVRRFRFSNTPILEHTENGDGMLFISCVIRSRQRHRLVAMVRHGGSDTRERVRVRFRTAPRPESVEGFSIKPPSVFNDLAQGRTSKRIPSNAYPWDDAVSAGHLKE
jgi:hypothetical protein